MYSSRKSALRAVEYMGVYSNLNEQELSVLLKSGDQLAYAEIFSRFQPLIFVHAFKKIQDEEEAKDVVQEIFADLWLRHSDFEPGKNLTAYLFTCVKHKFFNLLQHRQVREKYVQSFRQFAEDAKEHADHALREKQLSAIIDKEINALPEKMRQVFLLSRREHKSYKEIAEELNISEQTVKTQVKNALKILRARLSLLHYLVMLFWL